MRATHSSAWQAADELLQATGLADRLGLESWDDIDWEEALSLPLSGGERAVIAAARALVGEGAVDLYDLASCLDPRNWWHFTESIQTLRRS